MLGIIQALLRHAAAERLVLSQGHGGLSGESSPLLDLADPIDSNSVDRVVVAQVGSLAPGLVMPVMVAQLGSLAPGLVAPVVVSQLGSLAPGLVMPTVPAAFPLLAATQVAPVVPASSGNVTATGGEWFPETGVVPSLSSIRCVAVVGVGLLPPAEVSVFFQAPNLVALDASAFSMLDGSSVSSFMVEDDSPLFVLVVSPHRKYLAIEFIKAASLRHFSGTMLDISHSRTGLRRQTRGANITVSTDRIRDFNPLLVGEMVLSMITQQLSFLGSDSSLCLRQG